MSVLVIREEARGGVWQLAGLVELILQRAWRHHVRSVQVILLQQLLVLVDRSCHPVALYACGELPDEKVLITIVLCRLAVPPLSHLVNDLHDLVHEDDDLILKRLGGLCELADAADPEDHVHFLAWHH